MKKEPITLVGVGDVIIDRPRPETMFRHVSNVLQSADITYANMEQVLSDRGTPDPRQVVHSSSNVVNAYLAHKVDILSLATNHAMDWGEEGLLGTLETLERAKIPHLGAGRNLEEARMPVILERKGVRVGFLNYCTVARPDYAATKNSPGMAFIRVLTLYERVDYQPATPPLIISMTHKEDLAYIVESVKKLKTKVDVVVLLVHWGQHMLPAVIPDYCKEIAHAAVDAGADVIIGGHPHILKGIEMYKGAPIFYSLGNFAVELRSDLRERDLEHIAFLHNYYYIQDKTERRKTMIAKLKIEDGAVSRVSYIPAYENDDKEPEIVGRNDPRGMGVFSYVQEISEREGLQVHFEWDGDEVLVLP
jgi:poly-gamma-glutamate capsule biosynthesis protein CapA/YwtB (metallophosphatase superfamily)